jgi:hypothetical protein
MLVEHKETLWGTNIESPLTDWWGKEKNAFHQSW